MPTVALLPLIDGTATPRVVLKEQLLIVPGPAGDVPWLAHVAQQLARTSDPLILVLQGQAAQFAPALGFSRRALRRPAVGYVLVDPVMPQIGGEYGDWPDAPVTVVLTPDANEVAHDASRQARLRGWQVVESTVIDALTAMT